MPMVCGGSTVRSRGIYLRNHIAAGNRECTGEICNPVRVHGFQRQLWDRSGLRAVLSVGKWEAEWVCVRAAPVRR